MTTKYYTPTRIDKKNATYNVIFGERSNGKTYAMLRKGVMNYLKGMGSMAYVRRWKEDVTGRRAGSLFSGLIANGEIEKLTKGAYTGVHYISGKFYLCNYDDKGKAIYSDLDIVCYSFALSDVEHDKSTSYPTITTIIFDEFLTSKTYLVDEFVIFMNVVSTIVRRREDVKIYMLGNTVNKFCPYFNEMGLNHIPKMSQGVIDVYEYGNSELKVAVEYCSSVKSTAKSAKYFAFDNPKLNMITGGAWEMSIYPHLPYKYKPSEIMVQYYIVFNDELYQGNVVNKGDIYFTYIHRKTSEIKKPDTDLIYTFEHNPKPNYNRNILKPLTRVQEKILWFFKSDRVFYQDNNVGDSINNYLKICGSL